MIVAMLLAAATPQTAIDAERAVSADAHKIGQWAAFAKWAMPDAIMFLPQPSSAQAFVKGRAEPATAIYWWPGRSYVSCDGNTAINTGPAVYGVGKAVGYFSTVWQRQADGGWKWELDHGDVLKSARAEGGDIKAEQAACPTTPVPPIPQREVPEGVKIGGGSSKDGTINWQWTVLPDGGRTFVAMLWDGTRHKVVVEDKVAGR